MGQDLLPRAVSAVVGGPLGRRASDRSASVGHLLALVAGLTALPMVLAVTRQGHCLAKGWNGSDQFWRGCFSDLPSQYQLGGLSGGVTAWASGRVSLEQMPLLSGAMATIGGLVPQGGGWLDETRWYMAIWAVVITLLAVSVVVATGLTRPHRLDLATQAALSPVYVVAALLSPDLLVVALVMWAFFAWSRRRTVVTGVLLGLALLGHSWVVFVALALVVTALAESRGADLRRTLGTAAAVAGAGVALCLLLAPTIVTGPLERWWSSGSGYGSPWHVLALFDRALPVWAVTTLAVLGMLAAVLGGLVFAREAWRTPSWAQLSAFVVPIVAMTSKSTPVQAAIWVVPLVILAGVSWRTHLGLAIVEIVHATALWVYIGGLSDADKGLPAPWYAVVILGRVMAWGFLLWSIWYTPNDLRGEQPAPPSSPPETVRDDYRPEPATG